MLTTDRFRELLLDHLFDLLDEVEARQVREFLEAHPESRLEAERARTLLAGAARCEFPALRFAAPAGEAISPTATSRRSARVATSKILGWAVALSLLLILGVTAYLVANHVGGFLDARRDYQTAELAVEDAHRARNQVIEERKAALKAANDKVAQAREAVEALASKRDADLAAADREIEAKQLVLEVAGPPAIQPGAPNQFQIETRSKSTHAPVTSRLNIRVLDNKNNVLFEEKDAHSQGSYTLHLPPNLEVKPDTQLSLDVTASSEGQVRGEMTERLSWAAPRYVAHLATDKPMYQPGQTVFFRSLTLNRANLQPPEEEFRIIFTVTNPQGAEVFRKEGETRLMKVTDAAARALLGPDQKPVRGIGVGEFFLADTPETVGGEYVLSVFDTDNRFPVEKRKFIVNKYTPDRLNKELDFHRTSYGAGEVVIANCKVSPADKNDGPRNITVVGAAANVDGREISAQTDGKINALGQVSVRFILPATIDRGRASLAVTFSDGGAVETIQKPVPVIVKKMFVEFFPEGGDLVAGVTNRVYFQAKNTLDKPADLKGRLLDAKGNEVAKVETFNDDREPGANQGLGVFAFTPESGTRYTLKIDEPRGIELPVPLEVRGGVKSDGVVLSVPTGVTENDQQLRVELRATGKPRSMLVGAYSRGRLLDQQRVQVEANRTTKVELKPADSAGGVVRVTAFEELDGAGGRKTFVPRAERLVFRKTSRAVKFSVEANKPRYAPGETVTLTLSASDEKGNPARAVALVSVVNQTVVTMADEKTARALPTHFAFAGEVRRGEDLEHADFFLGEHPKAAATLDLLLGVQGWRRFAEQSPDQFRRNDGLEAERMLVMTGQSGQRIVNSLVFREQEILAEFQPKFKDSSDQLQRAVDEQLAAEKPDTFRRQLSEMESDFNEKNRAYEIAAVGMRPFDDRHRDVQRGVLPVVAGAAVLMALALVLIGVLRGARRAVPYYVGAALSVAVCLLLLAGTTVKDAAERGDMQVAQLDEVPETTIQPDEKDAAPNDNAQMAGAMMLPGGPVPPPGVADMPRPKAGEAIGMADPGKKPNVAMARMAPADKADVRAMRPGVKVNPVAKAPNKDVNRVAAARPLKAAGTPKPLARGGAEMRKMPGAELPARDRKAGDIDRFQHQLNLAMRGNRAKNPQQAAGAGRAMPARGGPAGRGFGGVQAENFGGGPGGPGGGRAGFGGGGFRGPMGPGGGPAGFAAAPVPPAEPFVVREFAFSNDKTGDVRSDFAETMYWNPVAVFDDAGKQTVTFQLADAVTRYRVLVAGHTVDGRLGQTTHLIEARKPFSVETKLPVELTRGDKLSLPVVIQNDTDSERVATVGIVAENLELTTGNAEERLTLGANKSSRRVFKLEPGIAEGQAKLRIVGTSEPFGSDSVERVIPIVSDGFPTAGARSDLLASDLLEKIARHELVLPNDFVKGTLKLKAQIFPSTLADLQKGLDGLLREPGGCFEQASTTNYPNTLILNYIKESGEENRVAMERAQELLARGYQRLNSFECQKPTGQGREGYEWFGGQAPPHEALTAYGLMQFKDMAAVHPVDQEMLQRTRAYLLSRRKSEGGFLRNDRAVDSFGRAPQHLTDAYILWSLTETGKDDLAKDIDKVLKDNAASTDPYFLSLMANALMNGDGADNRTRAIELLKKVRAKQADTGFVDGATTSITSSGGRDLQIEATALAVLGWLKANDPKEFTDPLNKAVKWISQQRGGYGGFGSTQSTILALKALIGYTKANKRTPEGGELRLFVGNQLVGSTKFPPGTQDAVTVEVAEPEKVLKAGKNELRLELNTKGSYPFTIGWSFASLTPPNSDKCQVRFDAKLDKERCLEGEGVRLSVQLENVAGEGKGLPMTIAVIGLPAGLKVPEDMKQLKQMAMLQRNAAGEFESGEISFFEIRGRELILYWRDMKPGAKLDLAIDLIAEIPGEFRGPASRAYLYYNADHKWWSSPLKIAIEPRGN